MAALPALLRGRGGPCPLIVTANCDEALERGFREAGEELDVVSYVASGRDRGKFWHLAPDGSTTLVEVPNTYAAALALEQRAVLLKLHGRVDRSLEREHESFVVTEDDYIGYLARTEVVSAVPVGLAARLRRSHFLFLGYSPRDWSSRVILDRLWGERPVAYRCWAVASELDPVEEEFWRYRGRRGHSRPARRLRRRTGGTRAGARGNAGMTVRADGPGTSPYKGLAPFEDSELDALLFFGRDGEREVITANLQASRLTVLYGPSGCGKSSVLRAGVAHALRRQAEANLDEGREPEHAVVVFDRWSDDPAEGIAAAVAEAITPLAGALPDGNGALPLSERVGAWARRLGGELYLILDQAEEYFLYRPADEEDEFARELPELVGRPDLPVNVLVSLREDALGRLDVFRAGIPTLFTNTLRLALLDGSAARDAVVGPLGRYAGLADAAGPVEIEPELVEAVLADTRAGEIELGAGGPSGLAFAPSEGVETAFLQLVLARLWQTERDAGSNTLRLETFQRLGGAERIVQDHLDAALAAFTPEQRDAAAAAFNHLVTPSGTKVAHGVDDLATYSGVEPGFLAPVLTGLAEQRILRPLPPADGSSDPRYEIFHDVLAAPILGWRAEHETERRLAGERGEARRRHRRLLGVTIASLVGLAIAVGLAIFALTQRSEAQEQAKVAQSRELAASALGVLPVDPELSTLLALEAATSRRHPRRKVLFAIPSSHPVYVRF